MLQSFHKKLFESSEDVTALTGTDLEGSSRFVPCHELGRCPSSHRCFLSECSIAEGLPLSSKNTKTHPQRFLKISVTVMQVHLASSQRLTWEQAASLQTATRTETSACLECMAWPVLGICSLWTWFLRSHMLQEITFIWYFLGEQGMETEGAGCFYEGPRRYSWSPPPAPEGKVC